MTRLGYWIQRADYRSTDYEPVDVEAAVRVVRSHDWPRELRLERELQASGADWCPAGIGFVDGGRILHICPGSDGTALVHYDFDEARVQFQPTPVPARVAIVIVSGLMIWRLAADGSLLRNLLALAAGMIVMYAIYAMSRTRQLSADVETVVLTKTGVMPADIVECVRRFYGKDHEWLAQTMRVTAPN